MSLALRSAEILPLHRPRLSCSWLPERHRLDLAFTGQVSGLAFQDAMLRAMEAHPEAAASDWLFDLRAYRGGVGQEDMTAVALRTRTLACGRDERALLVLVAPDPAFRHWAAICRAQFRPRQAAVVDSMAEAEALLASPAW